EGDTPVFSTLVSSGKPGHDTPTGLYRVERKYLYKTMRGEDKNGPYSVQEVPWTMYFHDAYAVHGAYWHDVFGRPRSHGCVNVPPADARWLYYWSEPALPRGWSSMYNRLGIHIYITGKTPPIEDDASASG
ncbi:MAG TPA: L,D-transpeptidase, partial [Kofleriaceae bacterium]|nr:L,D-transpeptidase [Kofleriaceae bacterium]